MRLVQIDVIGLETAERIIASFHDVLAGKAAVVLSRTDRPVNLGEQFIGFASDALKRSSQNLFSDCPGVDVGGVESCYPDIQSGRNAGLRGVLLDLASVGYPVTVRDS
ncbi:hypothetical protein GALL_445930 [mine drainage metagenome]|uniref:Uncharacterized protein n=1 Tax=mine drainage metagenome TaxID=410659 RepID=A0A1J5Q1L4_9ZZZZ